MQQDDYFLRLHVRRQPDGAMSSWLCDQIPVGGEVALQGPLGSCAYDEAHADTPLLVLGSGAGAGAMIGLVRDALARGHRGTIDLYVGVRDARELAALPHLDALLERAAEDPRLRVVRCISRPHVDGGARDPDVLVGHVTSYAFDPDMGGAAMYVCGPEDMVFEARRLAVRAGIHRRSVYADPFTPAHPGVPEDRERIALVAADPELWAALGRGHKLRTILEDFYTRVYDDPRLAPFFHNATKERAVSKQYSFLRDLFTGERAYFGLRPFNAHHWMIISDDLFDYREDLFEEVLREHGVPTQLARRWLALHETFRRDIVKSAPRGMFIDGVEHKLEGFSVETLEIDMVCDGCTEEMRAGERGRLHRRTGQLYCDRCAGRAETDLPGAGSGQHAVVG